MSASNWVHLEVAKIVRETDSAFFLELGGERAGEEQWLPKSQIHASEDYEVGDEDLTISVTEWIAEKKGLVG